MTQSEDGALDRAHRAALERVRRSLREAGASERAIDQAVAGDVLDLLAVDTLFVPARRRFTPRQVSETTALPLETLKRFWRALGFLEPADDDPVLTAMDVEAVRSLQALLALGVTELDTALQLARVMGSSMARVAEAGLRRGAEALGAADDSIMAADVFTAVAEETLDSMGRLLEFVWRRHMQAMARRAVMHRAAAGTSGAGPVLVVGFADMVGFTLLSQHLQDDELALVVRRFEELAYDIVTEAGGRVVKTIGDEAMFVVEDPVAGARIGVGLAEAYARDDLLSDVRVGMAAGPVLVRDGDYYGPVVNLAARIVGIADPGSVLVSDELHSMLEGTAPWAFAGRALRPRLLKDVGRVQLWTCWRAGEGATPPDPGGHGRARWERLATALRDLEELRSAGERFIAAGRRIAPGDRGTGPPGV